MKRLLWLALFLIPAPALADVRTANFIVSCNAAAWEQPIADAAEEFRTEHAQNWLGEPLPHNWNRPCVIRATVGDRLGNGGQTTFVFDNGEVYDWQMEIRGTPDELIPSVLRHEVLHTIFASHFRQPLPRWADEGACTSEESDAERAKHQRMLVEQLTNGRGIPLKILVRQSDYMPDVMAQYSQGHSLTEFLLAHADKPTFVGFLTDGLETEWPAAVERTYGYASLIDLQRSWVAWIEAGRPIQHEAGYG